MLIKMKSLRLICLGALATLLQKAMMDVMLAAGLNVMSEPFFDYPVDCLLLTFAKRVRESEVRLQCAWCGEAWKYKKRSGATNTEFWSSLRSSEDNRATVEQGTHNIYHIKNTWHEMVPKGDRFKKTLKHFAKHVLFVEERVTEKRNQLLARDATSSTH